MDITEIRLRQLKNDLEHNKALKNNGIKIAGNGISENGLEAIGVATDFNSKSLFSQNPNYNKNDLTDDLLNQVGNEDAASPEAIKTKMMSAIEKLSSEDIKTASDSGISLKDKDSKDFVTVTDQIKENFAKAGIDISKMGGLSARKMEALSGGDAAELSDLKNAVERLADNEPITSNNNTISSVDIQTAKAKASEISSISNDSALYLVKNNLSPTIENVYRAEFSGASKNVSKAGFIENSKGDEVSSQNQERNLSSDSYQISDETRKILNDMKDQLSDIFSKAGLDVNSEENYTLAGAFIENDIPLTVENLKAYQDISDGTLKNSPEKIEKAILDSINEGNRPEDAFMIDGLSDTEHAENAVDAINKATDETVSTLVSEGKELTIKNLSEVETGENPVSISASGNQNTEKALQIVTAQRTVAEAQLIMTSDAAISLIKQGIDIDTTDLATLVDTLKSQENALYKALLGENALVFNRSENAMGASNAITANTNYSIEEKIEIFENTNKVVTDLSDFPISILGDNDAISDEKIISNQSTSKNSSNSEDSQKQKDNVLDKTLSDLKDLGEKQKASYEKAGKEYETIGTSVRRDLGDSIKKAFSNVPEILESIGLEDTESNEQAVRILAYNNSEITKDSVLSTKNTAEKVKSTLSSLKPGVVAKLVKEGINPLDMSIDELSQRIEEVNASGDTSPEENFGKFLWQAEKNKDISDDEREGYVGIARLCYQVEKTDGAVIGQLLNEGRDITLRNMMSAIRTRKHEGTEYSVDDAFNGVNAVNTENNILNQVDNAFSSINMAASSDDENSLSEAERNIKEFETNRMNDASKILSVEKMRAFQEEENYLKLSPDGFATKLEEMEGKIDNTSSSNETSYVENFDVDLEKTSENEYYSSVKNDMVNSINAEKEVYVALMNFDLPVTTENLSAMNELMTNRNELYRGLFLNKAERNIFSETNEKADGKTISDVMEDLTESFGEASKTPESMAEAEEALYELAEHALDDAIVDKKTGSVDLKAMRLKETTLKFATELGNKSETYAIPIKVADQNGNMMLKIVRGKKEEKGAFELSLFSEKLGNVNATFKYSDGAVSGQVSADTEHTKEIFESCSENLVNEMAKISSSDVSISYSWDSSLDKNAVFNDNSLDYNFEIQSPSDSLNRSEIQTSKLYGMAKAFIDALSSV